MAITIVNHSVARLSYSIFGGSGSGISGHPGSGVSGYPGSGGSSGILASGYVASGSSSGVAVSGTPPYTVVFGWPQYPSYQLASASGTLVVSTSISS